MSWFSKIARNWGQLPFADPFEGIDNPYSRHVPGNPREKRKKDMTQDSLGLGSESHSPGEVSGNGPNEDQATSLSSFNEIDSKLYNGEIMNEDDTGKPRPRTTDRGGPSVGDSPNVLGIEDDAMGSYILRNTPNDSTVDEMKIRNFLRFQNRPSRRIRLNNSVVNVLD